MDVTSTPSAMADLPGSCEPVVDFSVNVKQHPLSQFVCLFFQGTNTNSLFPWYPLNFVINAGDNFVYVAWGLETEVCCKVQSLALV